MSAREELEVFGFVKVAEWNLGPLEAITYARINETEELNVLMRRRSSLYAFVEGDDVRYVGKTMVGLPSRLAGYKAEDPKQRTNYRCFQKIQASLRTGSVISIYALSFPPGLQHLGLDIDLAAGLEQSVITSLRPDWNVAGNKGRKRTESEVFEMEAAAVSEPAEATTTPSVGISATFEIKLGETYYNTGFFNVPKKVESLVGAHGENLVLHTSDGEFSANVEINRRANINGSPRLYGGMALAGWFQRHYRLGSFVSASVVAPLEIILQPPAKVSLT